LIRDLQTKLAHERMAKDEALDSVRRLETETHAAAQDQQTVEAELTSERLARCNTEDALAEAVEARQEADGRLRRMIAGQQVQCPPAAHGVKDITVTTHTVPASLEIGAEPDVNSTAWPTVPARKRKRRIAAGALDASTMNTDRGHLGPASNGKHESDIVEWWEPGWWERFR
jgi:hypothetical protein